jgi:hypothetical protein
MATAADLLDQLHGLVDQLLAIEPTTLSATDLHAATMRIEAERARLTVAASSVTREFAARRAWRSDGTLKPELAIGRDARRDHESARRDIRRAKWLHRMPLTRQAVLDGRLSVDHVDLLIQHAAGARFELFLESEALLVDRCAGLSLFDDARRVVQYWAGLADDQLGRRRERPAGSTLYLSRSAATGVGTLDGTLDPIDHEIVAPELQRLTREIALEDRRDGRQRTLAQRRAAALVRMATRSINATGATARPLFQVVVGDETARRLCQLASGTVVHPDDLVEHVDTALLEAFLFNGSEVVLTASKQRTFRGALRRAVQVRDKRCQHESVCPTPAVDADIDHRIPAGRGGPTSQFNGAVECIPHNRRPDLHGHPAPRPERPVTVLDALRCRMRWRMLRDLEDPDYAALFEPAR